MKKLLSATAMICLVVMLFSLVAGAAKPYQTYTYSIDGRALSSPDVYTPIAVYDSYRMGLEKDLVETNDIEVDESFGKGKLIDEIFGARCEGTYIQPTFITDYPIEMSPLTKRHRDDPRLTERFELMVNGKELANAYSELNDPIDQYERFVEQMRLADKGDDEAMIIDADFIRALEYGMPPTSGMGIGMDRLAMLLTGQTTIQEVLLFPQMKPERKASETVENETDGEKGDSESK